MASTIAQGERTPMRSQPRVGGELRGRVGADGVERDVAEVEQAGLADHDVEAEGEQDVDADREEQHALPVAVERRSGTRITNASTASSTSALHPQRQPVPPAARSGSTIAEPCGHAGSVRASCPRPPEVSPSRPVGPEHQHEDEHGEREHVLPLAAEHGRARVLEQPEQEAADSAPRMLPMPPSTAAVKALMPGRKPML